MEMKTKFIKKEIRYTGEQLRPHWIYTSFKICGDAIVAFCGKVAVGLDEMVDLEDVINSESISSNKMLNFIIECFDCTLSEMIYRQRLFMCIIKEVLEGRGKKITRDGDDLFYKKRKLSVSIATKSITSTLVHTALNIELGGAPIEISSLNEMGIEDIEDFANEVMKAFKREVEDVKVANCKVRGVF